MPDTTTDRELLELAARAAGICVVTTVRAAQVGCIKYEGHPGFMAGGSSWNPLADDGDAFRLAVALKLDVIHDDPQDNDAWVMAGGNMDCVEGVDGESARLAATRRAVVRAAAEIQRAREAG